MMLKQKYSREDFLEFQKQFLPDFKKDIRRVTSSGLKVTDNVVLLGQSEQLDLHIFEFTHKSTTDPRVSLAADGFKVMKDHAISQALAIYHSESSNDWRLSLMTATLDINPKGRITQTFSNPRRYSFFLGPEARIHTPEEFLIKQGRVKNQQDLVSRFDVEIVTKEFFQKYKALFESLQKFLDKDHAFTAFAEKNSIDIEAFAKKILGQIVFCYFLQKKGWLGAKKGEDINKGDKDFMRSLFTHAAEKKENFYNEYLEPLFYDSLNAAPEEPGDFYRKYFGSQIPFLNGGLFEPLENYDWKKSFLHIPDSLFSNKQGTGILDIFDLYNFTVCEDDPVDREVSVDPEMLGKVFENLLPENLRKGQGAYYTPREIVHYMCQESLINYLITETGLEEKNIHKLITAKEHLFTNGNEFFFSQAEIEKLDKALAGIKICDPACGSGAFLVGMLHEIVMARWILNPKSLEYRLKKEAIQNSIYGVDIDPGAVEIAKLRLWLSLVVDYKLEEIEPLPNLDYKIICGNSLLHIEKNLFNESVLSDLEKAKKLLFSESRRKQKEILRKQISSLFKQLVFECKNFDFGIYFSEVFHAKQGFDVIIANPPYVFSRENLDATTKNLFRRTYSLTQFKINLYILFVEKSFHLLNAKGSFAFIIPNNWLTLATNSDLRKFVLTNAFNIKIILNYEKVFESASVDTCILVFQKYGASETTMRNWNNKGIETLSSQKNEFYLSRKDHVIAGIASSKNGIHEILEKINRQSKPLELFADVKNGVQAYTVGEGTPTQTTAMKENRVYHSQTQKGKEWIKYLDGIDVTRYKVGWSGQFIKYGNNLSRPRVPSLFNGSRLLVRQIPAKPPFSILCAHIAEHVVNDNNIMIIKNRDGKIDLKYILALMNSRLMSFWFIHTLGKLQRKIFPQFKVKELRCFPIKSISETAQKPIVEATDNILALVEAEEKSSNASVVTKQEDCQKRIDALIYSLYELSSNEIKIIEESTERG